MVGEEPPQIELDAWTDGPAGQARSGAAGNHRLAVRGTRLQRRDNVIGVLRTHDTRRNDLVNACVRGVECSREPIKAHLAANTPLQFLEQR